MERQFFIIEKKDKILILANVCTSDAWYSSTLTNIILELDLTICSGVNVKCTFCYKVLIVCLVP